jgi:hypothetical protein
MAKYLFAYHGGSMPEDPTEVATVMAAWETWMGSLGGALVDGGAPTASLSTVAGAGVADGGGANPVSGYSFYEADDLESAIKAAQGCPIIDGGGSPKNGARRAQGSAGPATSCCGQP